MSVRNLIGCARVLVIVLLPGLAGCQTAADYAGMREKIDELNKNVTKLADDVREAAKGGVSQKDLDTVRDRMVTGERTGFEQLAKLKADLAAANERLANVGASTAQIDGLKERLAKVESDLQANLEVANDQRNAFGHIVKNDVAGNAILCIEEQIEQSPQFRDEFRKAVIEVTTPAVPPAQSGKLRIDNRMPIRQQLEVNGVAYWVGPMSYLDVTVPVGPATTRLVGYEAAKIWPIAAPDYFQRVVIVDRHPLNNAFVRYP